MWWVNSIELIFYFVAWFIIIGILYFNKKQK